MDRDDMEVLLANPRGFCAGVERAIEIVERALAQHGAPIFVRHEIVPRSTALQSPHDVESGQLRRRTAIW